MSDDERRSPFSPPSAQPGELPTWRPDTVAIAGGRPEDTPDAPLNAPPVFASAYHAGGPAAYARDGNPTWTAFEAVVRDLEGGDAALAFASGMAATAAVFELVPVGGTVVVLRDGYYGTRAFLDNAAPGRWDVRPVDITDTEATIASCDGAHLIWIESPSNPLLGIADIAALAQGAHTAGAIVAVDNTLMTPLGQQPISLGADVVVHSATKLLAGHSDVVLGVTVTSAASGLCERLGHQRSFAGAVPGPMEVFLALRGLRTLPLRLERGAQNALELARRLDAHSGVTCVHHPGLEADPGHQLARQQMQSYGTMLSFEAAGGASAAEAIARSTRLIVHATSLGGIETTIERRAKWPGEIAPPALLRLSVGCEDVEDLWDDLEHALRIAQAVRAIDATSVQITSQRQSPPRQSG